MAQVTGILCQVITGNVDGAGTDGRVYLGLGAREFRMDSSADDYERGSWREYLIGHPPVEPDPNNIPGQQSASSTVLGTIRVMWGFPSTG